MNYNDPCSIAIETDQKIREIIDLPAEIFDIPEISNTDDFNLNDYLSSDYDY